MNGTVMLIIYVVLFGGIFYFLAVRPQRRQKAQHSEMMSMLKRGDEVVTIGGMYGTVKKVGPDWVVVEVAPRTQIRFMKRAISSITTPQMDEEEEYVEEEEYEDEYEETEQLEAGEEYEDEEYDESAEGEEAAEDEETEDSADEDVVPEAPAAPEAKKPGAKAPKQGTGS